MKNVGPSPIIRFFATAVAGVVLVATPVALALALRPGVSTNATPAQPVTSATPNTVPTVRPGFPAPPAGATVFSRELGADALALGIVPQRRQVLAQASVLGPQGEGVTGLAVSFAVGASRALGVACGPGCYRATLPLRGAPSAIDLTVRGTRWRVALPARWPPRDAGAVVARAGAVWRSLRSLSYSEHLGSGPGQAVTSSWRIDAPDRIEYHVKGGWAAVIVGSRRWDRPPGSRRWTPSPQLRVTQPQPFWVSAVDAHVLGTVTARGRPALRVSFFDPGTPAWFEVVLDRATLRTLELRMITNGHFMHDVYDSFNSTPRVLPPG